MPVPAFGHKSFMQMGAKETTFGVFNAPAGVYKYRYDVLSWTLNPVVGVARDKSMGGIPSRKAIYQGPIYYKGTVSLKANFEGLKEFLRAIYGGYASNSSLVTLDDTFSDATLTNSYSLEMSWGDLPTTKVFHILGVKFIGLLLKLTASTGDDGMGQFDLSFVARDVDTNGGVGFTATGGINLAAQFPAFFHQAVVIDDGTLDSQLNLRVNSLECTFESPHVEDRTYLGSILMDEFIRNDWIVAKMKFTQEFNSMSQWQAARNFTVGSPRVVLHHPTFLQSVVETSLCNVSAPGVSTITRAAGSFTADGVKAGHYVDTASGTFPPGTYVVTPGTTSMTVANNAGGSLAALVNGTLTFGTNREIEFRMNSANLTDLPVPIDKWGKLTSTATWEGFFDPTDLSGSIVRVRGSEPALP